MPSLIPVDRPDAALDIFSGSHGITVDTVTADTCVVRGNMYSTTYNYTNDVQASALRSPVQGENSNHQLSGTAPSSGEVPGFLHRLMRPFLIYTRGQNSGTDCGFSLLSLDDDSKAPSRKKTPGEVYVYTMLHAGKGLPCWKPEPRRPLKIGEGVVPGDVGIFSIEGGFRKIFNIWDDEAVIRNSAPAESCEVPYQAPPRPTLFVKANELIEGQALAAGAWYETIYESDNRTIARFEFHHLESHHQGAVLAMSSTGRLEELDDSDKMALREFLCQFAALLYKYANDIRPIDTGESLYFITGCIKSENWALAAFRDSVVHPQHVPKLVRLSWHSSSDPHSPTYAWRSPGTFDSYVGRSEVSGSQDQALFLRGFKLDFSQSFRSQAKRPQTLPTKRYDAEGDGTSNSPDPKGTGGNGGRLGTGHRGGGKGWRDGSWGQGGSSGGTPSNYEAVESAFLVTSFPDESRQESCHPCDTINKFLLDQTKSDFALCHDDDWRFILEGKSNTLPEVPQEYSPQFVSVYKGVALLSIRGVENMDPCAQAVEENSSMLAGEQAPYPPVSSVVRPQHDSPVRNGSPPGTSQLPFPTPTPVQAMSMDKRNKRAAQHALTQSDGVKILSWKTGQSVDKRPARVKQSKSFAGSAASPMLGRPTPSTYQADVPQLEHPPSLPLHVTHWLPPPAAYSGRPWAARSIPQPQELALATRSNASQEGSSGAFIPSTYHGLTHYPGDHLAPVAPVREAGGLAPPFPSQTFPPTYDQTGAPQIGRPYTPSFSEPYSQPFPLSSSQYPPPPDMRNQPFPSPYGSFIETHISHDNLLTPESALQLRHYPRHRRSPSPPRPSTGPYYEFDPLQVDGQNESSWSF